MATVGSFKVPRAENEPNARAHHDRFHKHYAKGSPDRKNLETAVQVLKAKSPLEIPLVVGGEEVRATFILSQPNPSAHASSIANYSSATAKNVAKAIESALLAKPSWETLPFSDRAAVFLRAADLISGKYRYELMAATMLGQGKNAWQAEIDAAAELVDFLRFNVQYAEELYAQQPIKNSPGVWNRVEYRPLEGFVYAVTPFNFTAIAGNLPCAPALMGNVVVWKPSPAAIASNWLLYSALIEAGLPPNVIQFVPGDAEEVTGEVLNHPEFASLHYTGSTAVFRKLYGKIAEGVANARYKSYPRIVGETGGKNYHLIHSSADIESAVVNTIRGAFEYQGQKCSATSRAYVPNSIWESFKKRLIEETKKLKVGPPESFDNFVGPVIHEASFDKLASAIDEANSDSKVKLLIGGKYDKSVGYFIHPTIYEVKDAKHPLLRRELFGPILAIYVYDDKAYDWICSTIDETSEYGLTGSVFARDRGAIRYAEERLRNSAGNFYINCKSTGAVVAQQPFGGGRASGTNDKAGSITLLSRFVSMRSIKEDFVGANEVLYPSNDA
ncbi:MAG: 1-pyrroline-5-carboxylate dehydrogenase [Geoglossum simile]|nr:MAG: 1-pyrroline-5-carboxylate dehydrogenase [Geoglossum simile]